jgi:dynein regulatry complex protein 1
MRATYQLNNEKLEYNFRLLHEREYDHTQQIQQQKKKINRLQDMLSTVKGKYSKLDKKYRQRNVELTEEYKRVTEQYKDLRTKFRHFQSYDEKKYKEVYDMSTDRVKEQVKKVLQADKVIHEQQLHFLWYPPQEDLFATPNIQPLAVDTPSTRSFSTPPMSPYAMSQNTIMNEKMSYVLALIMKETTFLSRFGDDGKDLDSESLLRALGVQNEEHAQILLSYFITDNKLVSRDKVVATLTAFLQEMKQNQAASSLATTSQTPTRVAFTEDGRESTAASIKQEEQQLQVIWERFAGVISPSTLSAWDALEREMTKYNKLLVEREGLIQNNTSLRHQNDELKILLNKYLTAKVNQELHVPPVAFVHNHVSGNR